jgi:hypothetical protein
MKEPNGQLEAVQPIHGPRTIALVPVYSGDDRDANIAAERARLEQARGRPFGHRTSPKYLSSCRLLRYARLDKRAFKIGRFLYRDPVDRGAPSCRKSNKSFLHSEYSCRRH